MKNNHKIIRDSIHGDIKIEGVFLDLLETPELQRLYNIKQLGLAHLVFPGAHHTRLEHSIGTFKMALQAVELLNLDKLESDLITCEVGDVLRYLDQKLRLRCNEVKECKT